MVALVVIFPYLPGSDSPAFRGASIFIGVLVTLGSSSVMGSVIAGIILTYVRPFDVGDRVKISDTVGDVVERSLLVTRLRTVKNVTTIIPNSMILGAHILRPNLSCIARIISNGVAYPPRRTRPAPSACRFASKQQVVINDARADAVGDFGVSRIVLVQPAPLRQP
jgi:hypothetical protein